MNEQDIFFAALDIDDPAAREQYLREACGENQELLGKVQSLLDSHDNVSKFLDTPAVQQIAGDPKGEIDATILHGAQTTHGDEDQRGTDDEVPLGYLQPSSQADSLGRLGHYEILEVVGHGAFGTVLRARDEKLQRVVAIKVLSPEMAATSPARKRFLREARSSAAVRHENVVSIYAVEDHPIPYLVMEYIPGKTLQQRLDEKGPLNLHDVLRLGKQIADGLAAAHAEGLIHRDVKPGNILLEGGMDDRVKITDFGLARTADDASMTQSGMIAGTPLYMAPEQALGHKLDQRADLFSLGSVLYQMLSGRPPFRAPTTVAVLKRVVDDTPRPIQEVIPEVPDWMCELIGHLHAKNPDERYGSASEVSELLARCTNDLQESRIPEIPDPRQAARDGGEDASGSADKTVVKLSRERTSGFSRPRRESILHSPLLKVAAVVLILLGVLGITEASGVTKLSTTVMRVVYGSGTLVIETDESDVEVTIDGKKIQIRGAGIAQLTLIPGEYEIEANKDGHPVKRELVHVTRNGSTSLRLSWEPRKPGVVRQKMEREDENAKPATHQFASGEWIDVIPLIDPQLDKWDIPGTTGKNEWRVENEELIVGGSDERFCKLLLPLDVDSGSIECEIEFTRRTGEGGFVVHLPKTKTGQFPVGVDPLELDGVFIGGQREAGTVISEGEKIKTGQRTAFRTKIRRRDDGDRLEFWLNGESIGSWNGNRDALAGFDRQGYPHHRRISLGTFGGTTQLVFHRIRVKMLDGGTAAMLRPARGELFSRRPTAPPPLANSPFDAEQAKAHQQAWAEYLGVPVEKQFVLGQDEEGNDIELKMVLIPPGEFLMGTNGIEVGKLIAERQAEKSDANVLLLKMEGPQHFVRITKPFWLGKYEFTTGQFRQFVERAGYKTDAETNGKGGFKAVDGKPVRQPDVSWDMLKNAKGDHGPVVNVSWNDAVKCCEWLTKENPGMAFSLPTEAQWEYACRAGSTTPWYGCETAEDLQQYAWFETNSKWIQRCGRLKPNAFGLHDMHGNVWEWCHDWLSGIYRDSPTDDPVRSEDVEHPLRVNRGGCFYNPARNLRAAKRGFAPPESCMFDRGFRVAAAVSFDEGRDDASKSADNQLDAEEALKHQQAWAEHLGIDVELENSIGMKLRLVPPPTDPDSPLPPSSPPFYAGAYEVTVGQFRQFVKETDYTTEAEDDPQGGYWVRGVDLKAEGERDPEYVWSHENLAPSDDHPAGMMTWHDAQEFCQWLSQKEGRSYRLPTEAEWQWAASAGAAGDYYCGDDPQQLREHAWYLDNAERTSHPVGTKKQNPWGLYDVHGNLFELAFEWRNESVPRSVEQIAEGPSPDDTQIVCGGSYHDPPMAHWGRGGVSCQAPYSHVGFRVVLVGDLGVEVPSDSVEWPDDAPALATAPFDAEQAKKHQQAWAEYLGFAVEKEIVVGKDDNGNDVSLTMVLIPPGEYLMGSTEQEQAGFLERATAAMDTQAVNQFPTEGPQHPVRITRPFYLGKHELTQSQWQALMEGNPSRFQGDPQLPVEQLRMEEIRTFLTRLNESDSSTGMKFLLPTEAQWEYACRAGTPESWHSGNDWRELHEYGWFRVNSGGSTHLVGQLKPNSFGLFDMHGNVWEWCADWFSADYYATSPAKDPGGPSSGPHLVIRGGSWGRNPWSCRSSHRYSYGKPTFPGRVVNIRLGGIRLAAALPDEALRRKRPPVADDAKPGKRTFRSGEWIDVIPLIDPKQDKWSHVFAGENDWRIEENELFVGKDDNKAHKLIFPVDSDWPAFECELEFTRLEGNAGFCLNLASNNGDFPVVFDLLSRNWRKRCLRIGQGPKAGLFTEEEVIENGKRTSLRIEVRRGHGGHEVKVRRNDSLIGAWAGDRDESATGFDEGYPHARRIGLYTFGAGDSEFVFHRIRVRMLDGGTATTLRPSTVTAAKDAEPASLEQSGETKPTAAP